MMFSSDINEKVKILVEIDDSLLNLFGPMERSVIIALKKMEKNRAENKVGH